MSDYSDDRVIPSIQKKRRPEDGGIAMRVRNSVVGLLLVGFLLAAASPASAVITSFGPLSVLHIPADDESVAFGTITCTEGETFLVEVRVAQKDPGYRGYGFITGTCIGRPQAAGVTVLSVSGDLVAGVRTRMIAVAKSFDDNVVTDKERIVTFSTPTDPT
jgi:hypothetical protein